MAQVSGNQVVDDSERLERCLQEFVGKPWPLPQHGPDAVNLPMIRHFVEALGDTNPIYLDDDHPAAKRRGGIVAPPAMLQAWIMPGLRRQGTRQDLRDLRTPQEEVIELCVAAGYTAVVATDSEQDYHRELHIGDQVRAHAVVEAVSAEKRTALGPGFFVTSRSSYRVGEEVVAEMLFRILLYRPEPRVPAEQPPEQPMASLAPPVPILTQDNAFFFEGLARGDLLLQRCSGCGELRHPPQPRCTACGSYEWDTSRASGRAKLHSFVVIHHPAMPGFEYPLPVGLVELEEGIRLVAPLAMSPESPLPPEIGQPLVAELKRSEDSVSAFLRFGPAPAQCSSGTGSPLWAEAAVGQRLPPLAVPVTRTSIIAGAIATRDYQDVHHDPVMAREKGSPDIFMNILTTNGYVGRYATDWAGPDAVLERIAIRLGVPNYPGDTMTFSGEVVATEEPGKVQLAIKGANKLGQHVTGTVVLRLPEGERA